MVGRCIICHLQGHKNQTTVSLVGKGSFYAAASKQKVASSLEEEQIGVTDTLPKVL